MVTEAMPLDYMYVEWLYKRCIGALQQRNPSRTYWKLAKHLHSIPFEWHVRNDENRAEDGKLLRDQFIDEMDVEDIEIGWLQLDASVLEMLIALADRAAFETDMAAGDWFWIFMENLGLKDYNDRAWDDEVEQHVNEICARLIHRRYQRNGAGGLFPLRHAIQDQRNVELAYQMATYLLEGRYRAS